MLTVADRTGLAVADLSSLAPPTDPRTNLPAFGQLPRVAAFDGLVTRVLAPNPSPMTLDGTNTYVIGDAEGAAIVDPGPADDDHLAAVTEVVRSGDLDVAAIVVTHHHIDHAEAARDWAGRFGAQLYATTPQVAGARGTVLTDGDVVGVGPTALHAVATPGHCGDHLAYRLDSGALLSGDHVLGRGTSVVTHPDGDLVAYLDSLRRVLALGPHVLYPGHGPELTDDPSAIVRFYLDHREFRKRQILTVLDQDGPSTPGEIVAQVYAAVDRALWPAAEASTRAALQAMEDLGEVARDGDRFRR